MRRSGFRLPLTLLAGSAILWSTAVWAEERSESPALQLTLEQKEEFLHTAKIVRMRAASKGVTGSQRATLTDGHVTHDAHIQSIDISKAEFKTDHGIELNFKDSYKFNIAAYRLCRLLGLEDMTPVSVERKVAGKTSAVTWWVDDVLMDESARHDKKLEAPNAEAWNEQMFAVRVFDQLIFNTDRNLQNLLITKSWNLQMIDHSRAFRLSRNLQNEKNLVKCDRALLKHLRELKEDVLLQELRPYLTKSEVEGILARRDKIVKFFDDQVAAKGEKAVLYDLHLNKTASN